MDLLNYKDYIKSKSLGSRTYEVEVRFTEYSQKRGISLRTYNRLIDYYSTKKIPKIQINQIDYISEDTRKTTKDGITTWLKKVSV